MAESCASECQGQVIKCSRMENRVLDDIGYRARSGKYILQTLQMQRMFNFFEHAERCPKSRKGTNSDGKTVYLTRSTILHTHLMKIMAHHFRMIPDLTLLSLNTKISNRLCPQNTHQRAVNTIFHSILHCTHKETKAGERCTYYFFCLFHNSTVFDYSIPPRPLHRRPLSSLLHLSPHDILKL